jgi:hypothetical protein
MRRSLLERFVDELAGVFPGLLPGGRLVADHRVIAPWLVELG